MSNILVINSGSTSVKYKLFDDKEAQLQAGCFNNVGDYEKIVKEILREIKDLSELKAVAHRVVHGGDEFVEPTLIDEAILEKLEKYNHLAPLHNSYNIFGIRASLEFLPNIPQVAVFDTAFYFNLPPVARAYALPKEIVKKYNIKRFGFHGISHQYVLEEAKIKLDKKNPNLIICHLGGGWSVTAIKNGRAVDTSMGWTPLEGLVMMTRAGDLDPGIIVELFKNSTKETVAEMSEEIYDILNNQSGIKALSDGIDDYKELLKEVSLGDEQAKLAFDSAIYKLCKYIGAYWAVLGGQVEAIIFTGAIGAGNPMTRNKVMEKLKWLKEVEWLTIETNEELMIARQVNKVIS